MVLTASEYALAVIIGVLAAIVYTLRILVMLERRIARIEEHIEKQTAEILRYEKRPKRR